MDIFLGVYLTKTFLFLCGRNFTDFTSQYGLMDFSHLAIDFQKSKSYTNGFWFGMSLDKQKP